MFIVIALALTMMSTDATMVTAVHWFGDVIMPPTGDHLSGG